MRLLALFQLNSISIQILLNSTVVECFMGFVEVIRKFPELFLWFIFTYLPLLFLWFIFTIVGPEKWEGQNGQPKEENLRC